MKTLTSLEDLVVFQRPSGQEIDIFRIIGEIHFPRLLTSDLLGQLSRTATSRSLWKTIEILCEAFG